MLQSPPPPPSPLPPLPSPPDLVYDTGWFYFYITFLHLVLGRNLVARGDGRFTAGRLNGGGGKVAAAGTGSGGRGRGGTSWGGCGAARGPPTRRGVPPPPFGPVPPPAAAGGDPRGAGRAEGAGARGGVGGAGGRRPPGRRRGIPGVGAAPRGSSARPVSPRWGTGPPPASRPAARCRPPRCPAACSAQATGGRPQVRRRRAGLAGLSLCRPRFPSTQLPGTCARAAMGLVGPRGPLCPPPLRPDTPPPPPPPPRARLPSPGRGREGGAPVLAGVDSRRDGYLALQVSSRNEQLDESDAVPTVREICHSWAFLAHTSRFYKEEER